MSRVNYLFNAGPEGGAVTAANSGVSAVFSSNGGTETYAAAFANQLAYGAKFTANNGQSIARIAVPNTSYVQTFTGICTLPDVTQSAGDSNLATWNTGGSNTVARLQWKQTGALVISDTGTAHQITIAAPGVLTNGQKVRITVRLVGNATAGAGQATVTVYQPNGTTAIASGTSSSMNMVTTIANIDLGNQGGISAAQTFGWAEVGVDSDNTAELGPYTVGVNNPPVVSAGADTVVAAGAVATLAGTATDSDGTIASRLWTITGTPPGVTAPALTNAATATATFTPTVAGVYTAQFTATDNSGASASDTMTVSVTSTTVSVIGVTANAGAYTATPSGSGLVSVLSDSDNTTVAESPANPSAATLRMRLAPMPNGSTSFALTLAAAGPDGTGNLSCSCSLYEGSTLRKTWTFTPTGQDVVLSLTQAECATIGSWLALDVELSASAA